ILPKEIKKKFFKRFLSFFFFLTLQFLSLLLIINMADKNSSLLLGITICFCLLALSSCVVEAQRAGYPPVDMPPPPVPSWTALVDTSKFPNAPVRKVGDPCVAADPYCYWPCYNCLRTNDTDIPTCPQKTGKVWNKDFFFF